MFHRLPEAEIDSEGQRGDEFGETNRVRRRGIRGDGRRVGAHHANAFSYPMALRTTATLLIFSPPPVHPAREQRAATPTRSRRGSARPPSCDHGRRERSPA